MNSGRISTHDLDRLRDALVGARVEQQDDLVDPLDS